MLRKTILFAFLLLFVSMVSVFAEEIISKDGYVFTVTDGTAEITDYTGDATKLNIPASIEHQGKSYTVTSIRFMAFASCESLTSIGDSR